MREPPAFSVISGFDPEPLTTYTFPRHYLLYATDGLMALEAGGRCWTLPPARAAWIAANQPVNVRIARRITCSSLLFSPDDFAAPAHPLRVFDMTPLLREVILELRPFSRDRADLPPYARQLFDTAAVLAERLSATPSRAWMPSVRSDVLRRALALTKDNLTEPQCFADIAAAAGVTPRTLARRFADELGMTWRQAQRRLRMVHAVEHLSDDAATITEIAFSTGYNSLSAFNAAFREFTGQTPSDYRASVRAAAA
ncbi:MAG: AraC family transcriptional regulator [Rhodobacterales bacterium]|nr:AraC family transcriptional regulator [Rhodobacterales bacterium]